MTKRACSKWIFSARFRRNAFGWRSRPAVRHIKEAVVEIKRVARRDKLLAADGAVLLLERLSPALEQVDDSYGTVGRAVNKAIDALVPVIAAAPADRNQRESWLERLFDALQEDEIPCIGRLGERWGDLCTSPEIASDWADRLIGATRITLQPDDGRRGYFRGTRACLSALFAAGRYGEIVELAGEATFWDVKRWAVKALAAQGERAAAIRLAESSRGPWVSDSEIDSVCERILLGSGFTEEAYRRYGLTAHRARTYLAWFRAVVKQYPHKHPAEILDDLVALSPGKEGKWFAAAKDAGLFDRAIALANTSPCDPLTLARAARDFADERPAFAAEAGLAALRWLAEGFGRESTGEDVLLAYTCTMKAASHAGCVEQTRERIRKIVERDAPAAGMLARALRSRRETWLVPDRPHRWG